MEERPVVEERHQVLGLKDGRRGRLPADDRAEHALGCGVIRSAWHAPQCRRPSQPFAARPPGRSGLKEGEQVGVDGVGLGGRHAVRESLVGLQRPVLQ